MQSGRFPGDKRLGTTDEGAVDAYGRLAADATTTLWCPVT
jgi:hypothetical protein